MKYVIQTINNRYYDSKISHLSVKVIPEENIPTDVMFLNFDYITYFSYNNEPLHSVDSPACVVFNEENEIIQEHWLQNGILHRTNGTAFNDHIKHEHVYFLNGVSMNVEEYERIIFNRKINVL